MSKKYSFVLSDRLRAIYNMIPNGRILCDVGTDHGFLPISLVLDEKIEGAIAMDLREGPLSRAKEHVSSYGLDSKIQIRLSDGLEKIEIGECTMVSICGMGGRNMTEILTKRMDVAKDVECMLLQPQSDIPDFRRFLYDNGFVISDEDCIFEDGKYYFLMLVRKSDSNQSLSDIEAEFGPVLLGKKNETLKEFIKKESRSNQNVLSNLKNAVDNERNRESLKKQEKYRDLLLEARDILGINL
ncbi:MAG: class I SAM-dependent methyltransferase [Lachnospiraceae bacterium]|nr:class I SAM-dependent methyltransferase [Lachnospiraceae bacterium]